VVTGSPPNLVVPEILNKNFGPLTGLTFASWMAFAIPVMLLNLFLAWLWLQKLQVSLYSLSLF
jgi:sodium-dependent dicarboxylate transporter 2/3/5